MPAASAAPIAASSQTGSPSRSRATTTAVDDAATPGPTLAAALWSAAVAFAAVVALATVAVALTPHARGIGLPAQLRYAVLVPASALAALAAALGYHRLRVARAPRPRRRFGLALAIAAAVTLGALAAGPRGLAAVAAPAVVVSALALAWLVPRAAERRRRRRLALAAVALVGAVEVAGAVAAWASERPAPRGADGLAFAVPRALFDVEHRFVTLPSGARVHYVDEGHGETLLFLHGNPAWSFQWRELIHELRGSYRCVALDYPGFGLSTAPAGYGFTAREQSHVVEEFIAQLGLRDLTLVMHDWGGPIGLGLAGRRPDLVRRVVLGNTWAWPTTTREPRGLFSVIAGGPVGEFVEMSFDGFVRLALGHDIAVRLPAEALEVYQHPFRPFAGRGVAAFYPGQIVAARDYMAEVEAGLGRVADRPALLFWGMRDPGFPRPDLGRFEAAFARHQTIELGDAGHFFFEGHAAVMVPAIEAFLKSSPLTD